MIRYAISYDELVSRVQAGVPTWLTRARERTDHSREALRFDGSSSIWSEVKPIFMDLQESKCGYCERKLESSATGKVEWDVEHYRPKSRIRRWKDQDIGEIPGGVASETGYYLLPYHLLNYVASCKVCNTRYKSDYFPVRGDRSLLIWDPRDPESEKALLIYPISDIDDDPEDILTFQGFVCIPRHDSGEKRERALVTIRFFELNVRDTLLIARAELILMLYELLTFAPNGNMIASLKRTLQSGKCVHANCGRAFIAVFAADELLAKTYADKASEYLVSMGR